MAMTDWKLSSDLFTPWSASPYYHLNPFMHSIMPTNLLVLGHIEKSKPGKPKTTPAKQKTKRQKLLRECLVLTQNIFFLVFPRFVVFCFEMKKQKTLFCLFFWMDMINQDLNKKTHVCFAFLLLLLWFDMVSKAKKQKKLQLFLFFEILVDSTRAKKTKNLRFLFFFAFIVVFWYVSKAKKILIFLFFEILVSSMHKVFVWLLKPKK